MRPRESDTTVFTRRRAAFISLTGLVASISPRTLPSSRDVLTFTSGGALVGLLLARGMENVGPPKLLDGDALERPRSDDDFGPQTCLR